MRPRRAKGPLPESWGTSSVGLRLRYYLLLHTIGRPSLQQILERRHVGFGLSARRPPHQRLGQFEKPSHLGFEEIFNKKNFAVCNEIIAEEFVEHAAAPFAQSAPGRVNGPQAMRQTAEWLLAQFPDLHMTVEAVVAEGDTVAARILSEGTNLGPLNGVMPPTGKGFSARQSHWYRVEEGKLVEHWATREDLPTMLQLGILQPPGGPPS